MIYQPHRFSCSGSGYAEGTLFPWTMSDFSLMDAIECGIVKLPRVPVAQNIPGDEMPMFRNLWENIRKDMPKKGRGKGGELDPLKLPTRLKTAFEALYGHYEKTFQLWEKAGIKVPPCFIVVCNNTSTSKLVYDYISGFHRKNEDGSTTLENGRLALFRNFDETTGNPLPRPNTILIDSEQLEAGDALDDNFRDMAADEIDRFRREKIERTGDAQSAEKITDQELLREVMNTVGKVGQLGGSIRCVVSVAMLTEGWDANTVTHVLGIRAFSTQLLCDLETDANCPERRDAGRTMLGFAQEAWLNSALAHSMAQWNLIAQDVLMAQFRLKQDNADAFSTDDWDGYPANRLRLLKHIRDTRVSNPVVVGGDAHSFLANDLRLDFDNAASPLVATEFVGTSISAYGPPYEWIARALPDNPHVHFFESRRRGYVCVDLERAHMQVRMRVVSDAADPKADIATLRTFAVEGGRPGVVAA